MRALFIDFCEWHDSNSSARTAIIDIISMLCIGNVDLSVLMTIASTFAAAIMTPFLTSKLASQFVAADPAGLFISTVQVVLFLVLLGAILNQY
ncbi:hypothetical protein M5K25_000223 [Dendrobium thyrsiflorum]|uniref:Uncharacterized protein n=1 Tax=Dendrobium thyrsiflorum TaxID=117978 RepID=A0ABD0W3T6_DENTH